MPANITPFAFVSSNSLPPLPFGKETHGLPASVKTRFGIVPPITQRAANRGGRIDDRGR
jgi:hypothetical protein